MTTGKKTRNELLAENEELRLRLEEAEETLNAIRSGAVDALVISSPEGEQVFTLQGAETPYRVLVESMNEGAASLDTDGNILYCNGKLAAMLQVPLERLMGTRLASYVVPGDRAIYADRLERCAVECDRVEISLIPAIGDPLPALFSCCAMNYSGETGIGVVLSDIRIQKEAEALIREAQLKTQMAEERERATEALRQSEERFRALVEASSDVVYCMSHDWTEMHHLVGRDFIADTEEPSSTWLDKYIHPDDQPHLMAVISEAIHTRGVFELEHRVLRVDGSLGWTFSRAIPILDERGEITEWFGMASDITDRKRYEDELDKERTILNSIMDCARNSHLVYLDREFNFVAVNETYAATCGYKPGEMIGRNHFDLYPDAENEALFARVRDTGQPLEFHDRPFVFPDQPERGTTYWDWTLTPVNGENGEVKALVFSLVETTNRKKAEEHIERLNRELRNRIAQLEAILDTSPIGLAIAEDAQGISIRGNRALEKMLGLPSGVELSLREENSAGYRVTSNGEEVPVDQLPMQRACRGEMVTGQLLDIERSDGKKLVLYCSAAPFLDEKGDHRGAVGAFMDITQRVQTENALRESEERLQQAFYVSRSFAFEWLPATDRVVRSESCATILNLPYDKAIHDTGRNFFRQIHTDDRDRFVRMMKDLTPANNTYSTQYRVLIDNGEVVELEEMAKAVFDSSGELERLVGVATDITERKRAAEALKKTNAQLRAIFDTVPVAIAITDSHGGNVQSNQAYDKLWGGPRPTAASVSDYEAYKAWWMESGEPVLPEQWASAQAVQKGESVIGQMMRIERFDGPTAFIHNSAAPILDETGRITGSAVAIMDISKLVQAEEALRRAYADMEAKVIERTRELREKDQMLILQSRQAAMGEMLANIAHQWRQPLNSLGLVIQQLPLFYEKGQLDGYLLEKTVRKSMEIIKHMSATIEDFRNFFRPDREKADFRLKGVIDHLLSLIMESFENNRIRIKVVENADPVVHGFQNELSQSLLNILNNARDAFIERGCANPAVTITIASEDGKNVITVADNAGGIPEEIITKVFDPYFTTKGPQHGTGVGLFMSKAIIEKNMGGRLSARNTGHGAEFRIEL